jgi:uncharacterized BrkB/YihY/UPF0761 family membrane protein
MVGITQVFTLIAPRLVSANPFYGTLGTVFVALAWLNLISMILLVGAAWVPAVRDALGAAAEGTEPA